MINFKRGIVRYLHLSADKEWKIYGNYKKKIITKPGFHSYPGTYLQNFLGYLVKIVRAISLIIDDHLKKQKCGFSQTKSVAVSKIADDDSHAAKQQKQCRESIFKYI